MKFIKKKKDKKKWKKKFFFFGKMKEKVCGGYVSVFCICTNLTYIYCTLSNWLFIILYCTDRWDMQQLYRYMVKENENLSLFFFNGIVMNKIINNNNNKNHQKEVSQETTFCSLPFIFFTDRGIPAHFLTHARILKTRNNTHPLSPWEKLAHSSDTYIILSLPLSI